MTKSLLRPWTELVRLHPDVESGALNDSDFAIDLGAIAENSPTLPAVYRDPQAFFGATYITTDLSRLFDEVLASLAGKGKYNRVLKLRTPFGGGKSHTLATLLHAARSRAALRSFPEFSSLSEPENVSIAVFDGEKFDAIQGRTLDNGQVIRTMWGWLAWQIDPVRAYPIVAENDKIGGSCGGDVIRRLLGEGSDGRPVLILIDELLKYAERAGAVVVGESSLQRQVKDFVGNLTVEVANSKNWAMVYSLPWSNSKEALNHLSLFQELDHIADRVDQLREPVQGDEVLHVIKKRLLGGTPPDDAAQKAADVYSGIVSGMQRSHSETEAGRRQADEEGIALRDRIQKAFPFHPALIDAMKDRWASLDAYQRTRGAIRFIGRVLHAMKKEGTTASLIGPGDIPLKSTEVRLQMLKELGAQNDYDAAISQDITGPSARAKQIDDRLARETPSLANVRPATRLATAILVYSFGGLKRTGKDESEHLPPGVTESELLAVCVGPDLDNITAKSVLADLKNLCVYLHYDGVRYCFKKDPNVVKLIEDEQKIVTEKEVLDRVRKQLFDKLAGQKNAIVWPEDSTKIPDGEPQFLLGYMPLEFAVLPSDEQQKQAMALLYQYGNKPRRYRNGLGLVVPDKRMAEGVKRALRSVIAIERVDSKRKALKLTDHQVDELKERRRTDELAAESAFKDLYNSVWLPIMNEAESGRTEGIEKVTNTGRPLQSTEIHNRVMELLTIGKQQVFSTVTPRKMTERIGLGDVGADGQPRLGLLVANIVDSFYGILGFHEPPRLESAAAIRKAVVKGVQEGMFGYTSGNTPTLGTSGKFDVNPNRVVLNRVMTEDEVDIESGFIIVPTAIPTPETPASISTGDTTHVQGGVDSGGGTISGGSTSVDGPVSGGSTIQPPSGQKVESIPAVTIKFRANSDQVFKVFKAVANLADQSDEGKVTVTIEGRSSQGIKVSWLRNAVEEPLDEADVERLN